MSRLRPSLDDVYLRPAMLREPATAALSANELRVLMDIAASSAACRVWTYTAPDPEGWCPILPSWKRALPKLGDLVEVSGDRVRIPQKWLVVGTVVPRFPIPSHVKRAVFARDGQQCVYCGSTDGPFELDHRLPVSRGGLDEVDNLCVSCVPCNRDKRTMTDSEWSARP